MKKTISLIIIVVMLLLCATTVFAKNEIKSEAENSNSLGDVSAKSAVLMEAETGKIIFAKKRRNGFYFN